MHPVPEPVARESADPNADRIAELRRLFPEAFTEGRVDFDKLKAALGEAVAFPERFLFTWAGRGDALDVLRTPSRATLVPSPAESVNFDATRNLFIEGDNLEVLKLLYKAYAGKVKLTSGEPAAYHDELELFADALKKGWVAEHVLWEVAIKEGYGLNSRIEELNRAADAAPLANVVYRVSDPEKDPEQHFLACLDDELNPDIGKALGLTADDLFVCRDRALDDTLAANLALQCRLKTI